MPMLRSVLLAAALIPAAAFAQMEAPPTSAGAPAAASTPGKDAAAKARLKEALQNDGQLRDINAQLDSAFRQADSDAGSIEGLLKQRAQRAAVIAKDTSVDLEGIRAGTQKRPAPRNIGNRKAGTQAGKGAAPMTQARSGEGPQAQEFTFTSFPGEEVSRGCGGTTTSQPNALTASYPGPVPDPNAGKSCVSEVWRYVTLDPPPKGKISAYVTLGPSLVHATSGRGSYTRAVAGIRFGSTEAPCEFHSSSSDDPGVSMLQTGAFADPMTCRIDKIPPGPLRIGPWVGISTFVSVEDPSNHAGGTAHLKPLQITLVVEPEPPFNPDKFRPELTRPSEPNPNLQATPDAMVSTCPAPTIATPTENRIYDQGPMILSVKAPQTATAPPGTTATISIDRVGGGNASLFDMPLNSTQDLGPIFGQNADGTFPIDATATYKITATINATKAGMPVSCTPSAPRTFKIARPSKPRPSRSTPDSPPNMIDERKPNPTDPPPVEQMQQMNQGR